MFSSLIILMVRADKNMYNICRAPNQLYFYFIQYYCILYNITVCVVRVYYYCNMYTWSFYL